jgi:hypothetical protein
MKFTCLKGHANSGTDTKGITSGRIHKRKALQRYLMVESDSLTELTPNLSVCWTQVYNSPKNGRTLKMLETAFLESAPVVSPERDRVLDLVRQQLTDIQADFADITPLTYNYESTSQKIGKARAKIDFLLDTLSKAA